MRRSFCWKLMSAYRSSAGRLFHSSGPAAAKHLSPLAAARGALPKIGIIPNVPPTSPKYVSNAFTTGICLSYRWRVNICSNDVRGCSYLSRCQLFAALQISTVSVEICRVENVDSMHEIWVTQIVIIHQSYSGVFIFIADLLVLNCYKFEFSENFTGFCSIACMK